MGFKFRDPGLLQVQPHQYHVIWDSDFVPGSSLLKNRNLSAAA